MKRSNVLLVICVLVGVALIGLSGWAFDWFHDNYERRKPESYNTETDAILRLLKTPDEWELDTFGIQHIGRGISIITENEMCVLVKGVSMNGEFRTNEIHAICSMASNVRKILILQSLEKAVDDGQPSTKIKRSEWWREWIAREQRRKGI